MGICVDVKYTGNTRIICLNLKECLCNLLIYLFYVFE